MIRTIIVENEKQQSDTLTGSLLKYHPGIEILAVCTTVLEAVEKINLQHPDLIFLDINLDIKEGGFQVLKFTNTVDYEVIFTTSYSEHAIRAIKACALDFLLKPYGEEDLNEAIQKFIDNKNPGSQKNKEALIYNYTIKQTDAALQKVGIPVLDGLDFITVAEIIFCKSENNCTDFYLTAKRKIRATKTLKWVEELMREHNFFRVHDSYLININHIKKYIRGGEGGTVELTDKYEADVSRRRKDAFLKALTDLNMIFHK